MPQIGLQKQKKVKVKKLGNHLKKYMKLLIHKSLKAVLLQIMELIIIKALMKLIIMALMKLIIKEGDKKVKKKQ